MGVIGSKPVVTSIRSSLPIRAAHQARQSDQHDPTTKKEPQEDQTEQVFSESPRQKPAEPIEEVREMLVFAKPVEDRENRQHRYLQSLVKRIGESMGFRATIEKAILGRDGHVDVELESDAVKIACEISVTNEAAYEVKNIKKCLDAAFDRVVVISSDERHLAKIKKLAASLILEAEQTKIEFLLPDAFYTWLETAAGDNQPTETVKGFKVKMKVKPSDEKKQSSKTKAISDIFMGAINRLRDKPDKDAD
jgi:hypothetical protein